MPEDRIFFSSQGRIAVAHSDTQRHEFLNFDIPNQVSWNLGPLFSDGRRVVLFSVEEGKPWSEVVDSHLWVYDIISTELTEIATRERPGAYMPCCFLYNDDSRMVVNPVIDGEQRVVSMELDGSDQVHITHEGQGYTYCVIMSPDGDRLAFHAAGPGGYEVYTTDLVGDDRRQVAGGVGHLYFGPSWSCDGQWLAYVDCTPATDPGHDWANICIGRPDGSEHRVATTGMRQWFGISYGGPETRGSGSNIPKWSPNELVCTYTRTMPHSKTAWQFQTDRPDTDHFNRDYYPEMARGGAQICVLDPFTGEVTELTEPGEFYWDFRATWSPDGGQIAFCRSKIGCPSELWVMDADGGNQRYLTTGWDDLGADHPTWG